MTDGLEGEPSFGDTLFTTLGASARAPFAGLLDGPPPEQGAAGWVDAAFTAFGGALAMPGTLIDTTIAAATSAILPPGLGFPAATILTGIHLGLPHYHPPTVAAGVPLPGFGPTVLVGALDVSIGGLPALRCGDVGFAFGCMGQPNFEVSTGSSNVFIGGKRAARELDFTRHCDPIPLLGTSNNAIGSSLGLLAVATMGASAVAHCWAAFSALEAPSISIDEQETRAQAELRQAVTGVAQTLADLALTPLQNTIGLIPPVGIPGDGMIVGGNPTVLIGGLPIPPVGDVFNNHFHDWLRRVSHATAVAALRRIPEGSWLHCRVFGEPVDAVTGHVFADHLDVDLGEGLAFTRRYDSRARGRVGDCGRGMRHAYERELEVWLHRCTYVDQHGTRVELPAFRGRDRVCADGYVLDRLDGHRYVVAHRGETMHFVASPGVRAARLVEIRSAGRTHTIERDGAGRFRAVRLGAGQLVASRDASGRIVSLVDERGVERARYAYEHDCLVAVRNAESREERFAYDDASRLIAWTDARGYRFVWRYDEQNRCVHTSGEDGQWSCDFVYEKYKTIVTHGSGLTVTLHYDAFGTVLRIVRSDGGFLLREKDATGRIVRERDAAGRIVEWLYDETGAHVARRDRFGNELPPDGDARDAPSPLARVLPLTLAAQLGARAGTESAVPPVPEALASLAAWALPMPDTDAAPRTERDGLGRVVRVVDARGRGTELRRDATGNVVEVVDRDRRVHRALVTGWNLVGSAIDPIGRRIDTTYTSTEEVRSYRDPLGSLTTYGRDSADRLTSITRDGRLVESYTYDTGDRLVEKRDADGAVLLRVAHHANALPAKIELAVGGTIALDYDARGRATRAALGEHDARLERDEDRTVLVDRIGEEGLRRWRFGEQEIVSLFERFEIRIDRRHERTVVHDPTGRATTFDLRGRGRVVRTLANGTREILAFDPEGRLEGRLAHRTASDGALTSWAVRYERSGEGDLLGLWDTARGERRFEIDDAHRLEAETDEHGARHVFAHDADDNLLLAGADHAIDGVLLRNLDTTFEHDARRRMSARCDCDGRRTEYGYDSLDQLVRVALPDGRVWSGSYDGLGRLRRFGVDGRDTRLFWDGDRIAAEVAHDGALRLHVYPDARALIPFAFVDYASVDAEPESGRAFFVFHDASGMPTQIEDASGRTVWWADRVDPYGALTLNATSEIDYALRWPGHYFDRDLGLHHNRFRAYDPTLGRYLQPDPIGHGGSPHGLYAYAPNPLVAVDLLGLTSSCEPAATHTTAEPTEGHPFAEMAAEWGVDPHTGRVTHGGLMYGVSPSEVDRLARLPPQAGEVHAIERRRRYLAEYEAPTPLPMGGWAESGFRANVNREASRPHEEAALAHLGAVRNNASSEEGGQRTHQYTEYVDRNGRSLGSTIDPRTGQPREIPERAIGAREVIARPDGILEHGDGTFDVIEHKHFRSDEGGVLDDSPQLRAEREMARRSGGEHVIVLTSDAGLDENGQPRVRPSATVAAGSVVLYYDASAGMLQLNPSTGRFDPVPSGS